MRHDLPGPAARSPRGAGKLCDRWPCRPRRAALPLFRGLPCPFSPAQGSFRRPVLSAGVPYAPFWHTSRPAFWHTNPFLKKFRGRVNPPGTLKRTPSPPGPPPIPSATRVPTPSWQRACQVYAAQRRQRSCQRAPFAAPHPCPLAAPWPRPTPQAATATVHGQPQPLSPAQAARRAIPGCDRGRHRRTAESQPTASRRERLRAGVTRCRARAAAGEARRAPRPAPRSGTA